MCQVHTGAYVSLLANVFDTRIISDQKSITAILHGSSGRGRAASGTMINILHACRIAPYTAIRAHTPTLASPAAPCGQFCNRQRFQHVFPLEIPKALSKSVYAHSKTPMGGTLCALTCGIDNVGGFQSNKRSTPRTVPKKTFYFLVLL